MSKIRPKRAEPRASRVHAPPPPEGYISFSFRHFARTRKLAISECTSLWFESLFERMKALSSLRPQELVSNRSGALRAHPIDFSTTSEPLGFSHLSPQLRGYTPYPFQLSKERGRVHGFFIDLVFHVVWLDPHHRLYA